MGILDIDPGIFESSAARYVALATGAALHIFLFRFGEWDLATTKLIKTFAGSQVLTAIALILGFPGHYASPLTALAVASKLAFTLLAGVYASMLIYRVFFHRLGGFPGPFMARLSNLYIVSLAGKNLQEYKEVEKLHEKYGDFVRTGPSALSVRSQHAVTAIHGSQSNCGKGPWYTVLHPKNSLQMVRTKAEHIPRRRVWDRGFSAKALRDYEPRVIGYTDQLMEQLAKREGQPVNATDWFNFYSFDVMGDMAWGKSFNMLRDGVKHYFMKSLHADMAGVGLFGHLMWMFPILLATPILNSDNKKFWVWLTAQVDERRRNRSARPDVFSWLLEEHESKSKPTHQEELNLLGDAYLIAVAGSDTTAGAITCLFFEVTRKPEVIALLQKEIDELFSSTEEIDSNALGRLPYMDAIINETLRLHPAVPSGVQRMTPPEGMTIDGTYIPGNTVVQIPTHTMNRDARFFAQPNEFIPERWTTRKELVMDDSPFKPFSTGRYSCVGKQLALMEIRWVMARIFRLYDVTFAPDQDPDTFLVNKKDTFTMSLDSLNLVFSPRS